MRAFLLTASAGSFSEAARQLGVAPSVVTKRVGQLEWALKGQLLSRTTRKVALTELGERYVTSIRRVVQEYDDIVSGMTRASSEVEGHIRIKASTTQAMGRLFPVLWAFQRRHPRISLDVAMRDRPTNPVETGYDIVFGIMQAPQEGVLEEPLFPIPRVLCAAPDYLERRGTPHHPREIADHDCVAYSLTESTWIFQAPAGPITVALRPHVATNSNVVIHDATCAGAGLGILSRQQAEPALASGQLVEVMPDYPVSDVWLKAYVPENRLEIARVQALLADIRATVAAGP
jgi:DNA-binding transcriptional LysR family regulator